MNPITTPHFLKLRFNFFGSSFSYDWLDTIKRDCDDIVIEKASLYISNMASLSGHDYHLQQGHRFKGNECG